MFEVEYHGSIALIRPLTDDVCEWLDENVSDEAQYFGQALVVEPRYLADLVCGMIEAGFVNSDPSRPAEGLEEV